jgi:hypothetical protein
MFGLFKKKKYNSVVKYFKVVDQDTATNFDNKAFIYDLLQFIDELKIGIPTNYNLMGPYPKEGWTDKNKFLRALERKKFKDVFYLYMEGENFTIVFTNSLPNFETPPSKGIIDLDIEVVSDKVPIMNLINSTKKLSDKLQFDYGYGFVSDKLLGRSESTWKVRWYGSTSRPDPNGMKWAKESIRIDEGKIKDLFSFNFLSKKHHMKILEAISPFGTNSVMPFDNNLDLWTIEAKDLEKYRKDFSDYIILDRNHVTADT